VRADEACAAGHHCAHVGSPLGRFRH
jgi:hypothetical protein